MIKIALDLTACTYDSLTLILKYTMPLAEDTKIRVLLYPKYVKQLKHMLEYKHPSIYYTSIGYRSHIYDYSARYQPPNHTPEQYIQQIIEAHKQLVHREFVRPIFLDLLAYRSRKLKDTLEYIEGPHAKKTGKKSNSN